MAGWGGARPNSGPKKGANGAAKAKATPTADGVNAKSATAPAEAKPPLRPMGMTPEMIFAFLEAAKERADNARNRPRTMDWNPFVIRQDTHFGPVGAHIAKKAPRKQMAMDDGLSSSNQFAVQAWMAGGLTSNVASEGLFFLGYPLLSEMAQRPEYRLLAEIPAEEMTRKWTKFRGTKDESTKEKDKPGQRNRDDDAADRRRLVRDEKPRTDARNKEIEEKIKELRDYEEELKVRGWFRTAAAQDRFFGISHLLLDMKGADVRTRNDPELAKSIGNGRDRISQAKLEKKCLRGMRIIEPIWVYPTTYNASNPADPSFYVPQVWYVMGTEYHRTRLLSFISRPVGDILKPAYAFGGLSSTQITQPYVDIWLRTRESVGEMIHTYSIINLETQLATTTMPGGSGGGSGDVLARIALFNWLRDNQGTMATDKNTESLKNLAVPLSGLPELQAQSQEHMASPARIPLVKFTGVQPMGLNATSEGELRAFEETISGYQEQEFRENLTTVYDIMQISLWGARDPDITHDYVPLREETPKEKAEIRKLEAETDQIRIDSGVVSQEEVRTKVVNDEESGFDGLDPADVPDLLDEEEEGLEPQGGRPQPQAEVGEKEQQTGDDAPTPEQAERNRRVTAGFDYRSKGAGKRSRKG
jgi:uncharacterized protein